jgi:hypothetical protein
MGCKIAKKKILGRGECSPDAVPVKTSFAQTKLPNTAAPRRRNGAGTVTKACSALFRAR